MGSGRLSEAAPPPLAKDQVTTVTMPCRLPQEIARASYAAYVDLTVRPTGMTTAVARPTMADPAGTGPGKDEDERGDLPPIEPRVI